MIIEVYSLILSKIDLSLIHIHQLYYVDIIRFNKASSLK